MALCLWAQHTALALQGVCDSLAWSSPEWINLATANPVLTCDKFLRSVKQYYSFSIKSGMYWRRNACRPPWDVWGTTNSFPIPFIDFPKLDCEMLIKIIPLVVSVNVSNIKMKHWNYVVCLLPITEWPGLWRAWWEWQLSKTLTSSGEVTPYCRCWYWGPAADPREQLLRWPARWKPSSVVVFLYTGLSKFMLCTDRLRKYR